MRDSIARLLAWALRLLLPAGKHRAVCRDTARTRPPAVPVKALRPPHSALTQASVVICAPRTPIPVHVLTRTMPLPPTMRPLVPLYMQHWQKELEKRERQRQRCVALVAGAMGYDYEYTYDGAHPYLAAVTA
ncbi:MULTISPECIES: hypothetical protein [Streptomyces]|uniref:hypothetical protein n=1 Tax=Streptomyces TaxID=1883 RepID=UPI00345C326A